MFGNEAGISTYIIVGIMLFTCTSFFSRGLLSKISTLSGLLMAVFALLTWF